MLTKRYILTGGPVLTMNPGGDVIDPGVVVLEDRRIVHVGRADGRPPAPGDIFVDCRDHLVMPGLVNTHTHAAMALFRGLGEGWTPEGWTAAAYTLPQQARAEPEDYYWGAMLGGLEMLLNGITCTADRFSHMRAIAPAFEHLGMRAVVCQTLWDVHRPDEWAAAEAVIARWGTSPEHRIRAGIGPHAPDTCSETLLRRVRRLADETRAPIFIHCAQSRAELEVLARRGHRGAVRCLADAGLLGPDLVAAHCIHVDDDEIRLLAASGTTVATCPVSNIRVEGRIPPIGAMLDAGVRVTLGTDWAVTNDGMDLFDEMKCAGLLAKAQAADPAVLPAERLLRMATVEGAAALGLGEVTGSLEPGKRADVIVLAMNSPHLQPARGLASILAYAAKGRDVRHVWVDGRWVIRDRRHVDLDFAAVRAETERICRRLYG